MGQGLFLELGWSSMLGGWESASYTWINNNDIPDVYKIWAPAALNNNKPLLVSILYGLWLYFILLNDFVTLFNINKLMIVGIWFGSKRWVVGTRSENEAKWLKIM